MRPETAVQISEETVPVNYLMCNVDKQEPRAIACKCWHTLEEASFQSQTVIHGSFESYQSQWFEDFGVRQ